MRARKEKNIHNKLTIVGKKIFEFIFGESKQQVTCRKMILGFLIFAAIFRGVLTLKDDKLEPCFDLNNIMVGLLLVVIIMFIFKLLDLIHNFTRIIPEDLRKYYFESQYQRIWIDLLFCSIITALFYTYFEFMPSQAYGIIFKTWKIIAILMSIALTIVYYADMEDKSSDINLKMFKMPNGKEFTIEKTERYIMGFGIAIILSFAIIFCIFDCIKIVLFILILCTIMFIYFDNKVKNKFLDLKKNISANNENEAELRYVNFIINNYTRSLIYGNLPGLIGFLILLAISHKIASAPFIAGGTAMHMIFGNIIVSVGLRSPKK